MTKIHPSSIIEPGAQFGENVKIGPFCHIGSHVVLGDNVELRSHICIDGHTIIGKNTQIFPFASLGLPPQDKKFDNECSRLEIGENTIIREYVTMHPGTKSGGMLTKVGKNGLFMIGVHIAHDCIVGDNVVFANQATLAGHAVVEDFVTIGGMSGVHQFTRIGAHAMVGGMSGVENDVIPFGLVMGNRAGLAGLNLIGLKRRGFSQKSISSLREVYRLLFNDVEGIKSTTFQERLSQVEQDFNDCEEVNQLLSFIRGESHRNLMFPKHAA